MLKKCSKKILTNKTSVVKKDKTMDENLKNSNSNESCRNQDQKQAESTQKEQDKKMDLDNQKKCN